MMLFVVGLNHGIPDYPAPGVTEAGVRELADAIVGAWPHPESVVVVGSAFMSDCAPTNGACLKTELEKRYGRPFTMVEELNTVPDKGFGTLGVIAGSRWSLVGHHRMTAGTNYEQGVARVSLRDTRTGLGVTMFAMHTSGEDACKGEDGTFGELEPIVRAAKNNFASNAIAPVFAGDFNFAADSAPHVSGFIRANLGWLNDEVPCPEVPGLTGGFFQTENGNKMHAMAGRLRANDPTYAFDCSVAELQRVRYSFSLDANGALAYRSGDGRPAQREGIILNKTAHNVIAAGLHIVRRTNPVPESCKFRVPPPPPHENCDPPMVWCACTQSCLSPFYCEKKREEGPCIRPSNENVDR